MITHHTQLLQYLIDKHQLKSYGEIGVQDCNNNFHKINCDHKIGIDPGPINADHRIAIGTSDEYFKTLAIPNIDIWFIDGLHHADQVKRDFENSLRCLNEGGYIVLHDTLPENEEGTRVPRETKMWWGDVYKFAMQLGIYKGIQFVTINIDNGCTVVWKAKEEYESLSEVCNWENYLRYRTQVLRIIEPAEIEKYL